MQFRRERSPWWAAPARTGRHAGQRRPMNRPNQWPHRPGHAAPRSAAFPGGDRHCPRSGTGHITGQRTGHGTGQGIHLSATLTRHAAKGSGTAWQHGSPPAPPCHAPAADQRPAVTLHSISRDAGGKIAVRHAGHSARSLAFTLARPAAGRGRRTAAACGRRRGGRDTPARGPRYPAGRRQVFCRAK